MNVRKPLPSKLKLRLFLTYDGEKLIWNYRSIEWFNSEMDYKRWNSRCAGQPAGNVNKKTGVVRICIDYRIIYAHRIIYKMVTGEEPSHIDHIDLNQSNNRIENLRPANDPKNGYNRLGWKNSISGLKGVSFDKNNKKKPWFTQVMKNRKNYTTGFYASKEEAFKAACILREKLHGEFCRHGR